MRAVSPSDRLGLVPPPGIALVLAEMVVARLRDRRRYCPRDTLTSLALGFGSTVAGALSLGVIYAAADWLWQFRLITVPWTWWAFALCFVADDQTGMPHAMMGMVKIVTLY